MIEQILQYDTDLFLFLNGLGTETWDGFWMFYTTKFYWIPLYAVLLYLVYKHQNKKAFLLTILVVALMVAFTDQVTNLFKDGFARPRPCHQEGVMDVMRLVKSYCGYPYGFVSGHASNSMGVAVFIGLMLRNQYKYLIFVMLFWAAVMAYSRVYIGVHYPLDIVCGMLLGACAGFGFYKLNRYLEHRFTKPS